MKKIIISIFIILLSYTGFSQVWTEIPAGKYYVITTKNDSDVVKKSTRLTSFWTYTGSGTLTADTVFYIPSTAPNDTITTLMTAANNQGDAAILLERGSTRRTAITISQDSLKFSSYGSGAKPIIDGADIITGFGSGSSPVTGFNSTLELMSYATPYLNIRQRVPADSLATDGTWVRIKIKGFYDGAHLDRITKIKGASIGLRSGTTDDFAAAPTRLTFGGYDTIDVEAGAEVWSDLIQFNITATSDYLVHFYLGATSSNYAYTTSTINSYRSTDATDGTLTQSVSYTGANSIRIISGIEVSSGIENIWVKTGISTQPYLMYLNDTVGNLQTSVADCDTINDFYWSNDSLYINAASDPSGKVELGQRKTLIKNFTGKDYITIRNLTLQHDNSESTSGFVGALYCSAGADNWAIENCTFQKNSMNGAMINSSDNIIVRNCLFQRNSEMYLKGENFWYYSNTPGKRNISFINNTCNSAGRNGLSIQGSTKVNEIYNVTVSGNSFNDNTDTGIYLSRLDSAAVYNNTFNNNGLPAAGTAAPEDYAIGLLGTDNIDIYKNTITNQVNNDAIQLWTDNGVHGDNVRIFRNTIKGVFDGDGIQAIGGDSTMENLQIYYNLIDSVIGNGIIIYKGDGTTVISTSGIYNNTINNASSAGVRWTAAGGITKTAFNSVIKNNIFTNIGSECVTASGATSGLVTSNNLYYNITSWLLRYNSITYSPATITGFEATAQTTDPLFTTPGSDYSLQTGSPAINTGVNVGLTTDILGNPIVGNPDIGAYEKQ